MLELSARGAGPHRRAVPRRAAADRGGAQRRHARTSASSARREAIAAAKGELVEALPADGVAVLNADDPAVAAMAARTRARVVLVGRSPDAQVRADDVALDAGRARFRLVTPRGSADVALRLVGAHHVGQRAGRRGGRARAAAPRPRASPRALSAAGPASRWRMEVIDRPDGVTVVNDAYNANPESMRAALQALVAIAAGRPAAHLGGARPRWASWATTPPPRTPRSPRPSAELEVDEPASPVRRTRRTAGARRGRRTSTRPSRCCARSCEPGDVVLVKASRAAGLEPAAAALVGSVRPRRAREPVA